MHTGRCIKRRNFTPLPAPPQIIAQFHYIADEDNQIPALNFYDWHGNNIEDDSLKNNTTIDNKSMITGVYEIYVKNTGMN